MNGKTILGTIGVGTLGSGLWWALDTKPIREWRIKQRMKHSVKEFKLKDGAPFIYKEPLRSDLIAAINDGNGGVKILWAPQGAGKTTTVRAICRDLEKEMNIRGAIVIKPSDDVSEQPSSWFRRSLSDFRGEILKPGEFLSDLLGSTDEKPYVIVLDQIENAAFDQHLKTFIKTLAEDSTLCKSYVVIVVCSDPANTVSMWGWNGRQKITLVGGQPSFGEYRWKEREIDQWVGKYLGGRSASSVDVQSFSYRMFREAAIAAGTPGFLVTHFPNDSEYESKDKSESLQRSSVYYQMLWKAGMDMLASEVKNVPRRESKT